ncbi:N-Dimethylarginine dimethylaminohydrolase [Bacillus sp. TS-2]|nr:N-Dimethylarginine dimethylaminohydrolase [Bacillus sp. TS-2]
MQDTYCQTEYDRLRSVILCEPTYMSIEEAINDIQKVYSRENIDSKKAQSEHQELLKTLRNHDINVKIIPAHSDFPEQVFTRDIGFVIDYTLYAGKLKREIRQGEHEQFKEFLQSENIVFQEISEGTIEGGDVIINGDHIYIGNSSRTAKDSLMQIRRNHEDKMIHLIEFDEKYLHLDCVFNPISDKEALVFTDAISEESLLLLKEHFQFIEVSKEEQFQLAVNVLSIGNKQIIALPKNTLTNQQLIDRGYTIIEVDFSEIIKSGGSFRCVTMPLWRENE